MSGSDEKVYKSETSRQKNSTSNKNEEEHKELTNFLNLLDENQNDNIDCVSEKIK